MCVCGVCVVCVCVEYVCVEYGVRVCECLCTRSITRVFERE